MARWKVTLSQDDWTGGTAAFWFDPDVGDNGTAYDAETGGNVVRSISVPSYPAYTCLGFGLTSPYWRCVNEHGVIMNAKVKELFNVNSAAVTGSLADKTLPMFYAQTSTISGPTATLRTIYIYSEYWADAPAQIYYNPDSETFFLDSDQTRPLTSPVVAERECWTYTGCFDGASPAYVSPDPAKSGDQYISANGLPTEELHIRAKVTTEFWIYPRGEYYSYKIILNAYGGSIGDSGVAAIYRPISATGTYYTSPLCESGTEIAALSAAQRPALSMYAFGGFTTTPVSSAADAATATYCVNADGSLVVANLDALPLSPSDYVSLVSATVYARWVILCTVTVDAGTNGTYASIPITTFYADTVHRRFYASTGLITNIGVPTNECYAFEGCYDSAAGSVQYVEADGDIAAALSIAEYTNDLTIFCQWRQTSWRLHLEKMYGADGSSAIYRSVSSGKWYADPLAESGGASPIDALVPPHRDSFVFAGYFKDEPYAVYAQLAARDGALNLENLATVTPSGATPPSATAYAVWLPLYTVTVTVNATAATVGELNAATAEAGDAQMFYSPDDDAYYADGFGTIPVGTAANPVTLPTVRCSDCIGIWSDATGGERKFDANGLRVAGASAPAEYSLTWYAQWLRKSYVAVLNANGGESDVAALFFDGQDNAFYSDDDLTAAVSSITPPTRAGYTFTGYFTGRASGTMVVAPDGSIALAVAFGARDITLFAHWSPNSYTLSFSGGGELSPVSVTFDRAVGALPSPAPSDVPPRSQFDCWTVEDIPISAETLWTWPSDKTAAARYRRAFGDAVDYFGLASASLVPIESGDGADRPHVVTRHYGKQAGADVTSLTKWVNPFVRYMVVRDMTLSLNLGTAYPATFETGVDYDGVTRSIMTRTGYMITSAIVETAARTFPVVTVSAVANEGADAINLFPVSVPILARARAQNLLGAISGGGEIVRFALSATCQPVVLAERFAPCASDVVDGRYEAQVETHAYDFDDAPAAAGGFQPNGAPAANGAREYMRYIPIARKDIY